MPKNSSFKTIFVIGSGPIVIGQACEFDYSGTQACRALREEGCRIVLLNSNPATIMTDPAFADATYIAPMTLDTCEKIIKKEKPDAILPTVGGQTALNLAVQLSEKKILEKYQVKLIGACVDVIKKAEDRRSFRQAMTKIGLEMPSVHTIFKLTELKSLRKALSFPLLIRHSFALGGEGSQIIDHYQALYTACDALFKQGAASIEIEESLFGWKEFEMEAIRDAKDNCIIVCGIENLDPMGIHTGDSITVAPTLTLCNKAYQAMRKATFAVMREIGVNTGGANVQFAVHPDTGKMLVIEMNPRVSRSSALASKATGYPIAKIAAKLSLGYTLDELENSLTREEIPASFEPTIDYIVTKLPRFNFEKFPACSGLLGTSMQSTGEVIALGSNFQESLLKAVSALESDFSSFPGLNCDESTLIDHLNKPYHDRLFYIAEAFRRGWKIDQVYKMTAIDKWFLAQIQDLIHLESAASIGMSGDELRALKQKGFSDKHIAEITKNSPKEIRDQRKAMQINPVFKRVDTCAAEFEVSGAYLYSTYADECEVNASSRKKICIIGSGANRIGQGIEFDYGSVHAAIIARTAGYETIMINSNPETVSTDFDVVDKLYLEPLTLEHVLNVVDAEAPDSVFIQFGGQTAISLASGLQEAGVRIAGTQSDVIEKCENRALFKQIISDLGFRQAKNFCIDNLMDWGDHADKLEYPFIMKPSYIISGARMVLIQNKQAFLQYRHQLSSGQCFPVLIEDFLEGAVEVDVDGVCDGESVFIPGIIEQIEPAGIHSGDSAAYFPAHTLSKSAQEEIIHTVKTLVLTLGIVGLFNAQLMVYQNNIYISEMNPRASRTVPFLSKATGSSLAAIGAQCMLGKTLAEQGIAMEYMTTTDFYALKEPIFPFGRLHTMPLGPEMRSIGEKMSWIHCKDVHAKREMASVCTIQDRHD